MLDAILTLEFVAAATIFVLLYGIIGLLFHTGRWEPFSWIDA